MKTEVIYIENLKCHGCANTIRTELKKTESVKDVSINHDDSSVTIGYESDENKREIFLKKLSKLGYPEKGSGNFGATVKSYVSCAIGRVKS
ncbi:MAG TPA: heavy metal transporter [Bacteroidales bacterium]|nr:MAG: hypothetical protein A2W98_05885 [Bacteroidetes bacterium GWF2_33_38]OFY92158.1 MAG: hypothetical protein A2236_07560 [Bacteroidetes bacterium RIFOXYA2_FULL_33_7]HBF88337.1 heavy metal transporter [Bacteroidales bacterium]